MGRSRVHRGHEVVDGQVAHPEAIRAVGVPACLSRTPPAVWSAARVGRIYRTRIMIGSPAVAGWLAHFVFWVLLAVGTLTGELRLKYQIGLVALWLAGWLGLPLLGTSGGLLVAPYVAVLDIVVALALFKRDMRLF